MHRFLVLCALACVVAVGVEPAAAAAAKRTCPKQVAEGGAVIPGESWFVRGGMSCAAGKRVLRRFNHLADNYDGWPKPHGYRCKQVPGDPRMIYCKKGKRRVDFWPAVSTDGNGAAVSATAKPRIKPKAGQWVRDITGPGTLFFEVTRNRRTAKNISASLWCGAKLTSVPIGNARIRKVGRHTVGFDISRRVSMPHGHKVKVTMSGVWSGPKHVGGTLHLRDPKCGPPPYGVDNPREWTAFWNKGNQPGS